MYIVSNTCVLYTFSSKSGAECVHSHMYIYLRAHTHTHTHTHTHIILYTGKTETTSDKLRSVLAQLEFSHRVRKYAEQGVPFIYFMYVPEEHPITKYPICEREDEGHVLKVQ